MNTVTEETSTTEYHGRHRYEDDRAVGHRWPWSYPLSTDGDPNYLGRHRNYMDEDVECGYGHTMPRRELFAHECPELVAARQRGRALIERLEATACDTCDNTGEVRIESQIGAPGSGGLITCPDCRSLPAQAVSS